MSTKSRTVLSVVLCLICAATVGAQGIEGLVSPGELSRPHEKLAGLRGCQACHGGDKGVIEAKCLECHKSLALRISEKKGFHADKGTGCMRCHSEHLGKDFDIRGLDSKSFKHEQTGYALTGRHLLVRDCSRCHKQGSFIGQKTECQSCHQDKHAGRLPDCASCHSIDKAMKDVAFDHEKTTYPLRGAHARAACARCHRNETYKGTPAETCASCHRDPHTGSLGADCARCHSTEQWKTVSVPHPKFPLTGKHAAVACAACHKGGKWKNIPFARCSDCHKDIHYGQFNERCEACHTVNSFKPAKVAHTTYKLEAKHASVACEKCHKRESARFPAGQGAAVRYRPLKTDCVSCHRDVHAGQLGARCESCHSVAGFKISTFDHSSTRYPLDAKHAKVPCEKCHKRDARTGAVAYKPLGMSCNSCHRDVHLGQLGTNCDSCHARTGLIVDHNATAYKLTGRHEKVPCEKCHRKERGRFPAGEGEAVRYKPIDVRCVSCHVDYHRGQFVAGCGDCHSTTAFKPSTFRHESSEFRLEGRHASIDCAQCHKTERFAAAAPAVDLVRYRPVPKDCTPCHKDPHAGAMQNDCSRCHGVTTWAAVDNSFHRNTSFPLTGKHLPVPCASCHVGSTATPTTCEGCHWQRRRDDPYEARLGMSCGQCHNTGAWTPARFDHAASTSFPLVAEHSGIACQTCHGPKMGIAPATCVGCHRDDYDRAAKPPHVSIGFSTDCAQCHRAGGGAWTGATYQHRAYVPAGRHKVAACAECHGGGKYEDLSRACTACHRDEYDRAKDPDHRKAGFPVDCERCHRAGDASWQRGLFDHSTTGFALSGAHQQLQCAQCHVNNNYTGLQTTCAGCHQDDYDSAGDPNHRKAGFSTDCVSCHFRNDARWNQGRFDHEKTGYLLQGAHTALACRQCHASGQYAGLSTGCSSCHTDDYDSAKDPDHKKSGFSTSCENCHRVTDGDWHQGRFDHASSDFPLDGAHAKLACDRCHSGGTYSGLSSSCYSCHKADYDGTTDPNHKQSGFPTDCTACHRSTDTRWDQGRFDHNSTDFPLQGAHTKLACERCHNGGTYTGLSASCYSCHKADYDGTTDPNHKQSGFPTDCTACHRATDTRWDQGRFDHNNTDFPLQGAHTKLACERCHKGGTYTGLSASCYSCHKADYDGTTDPNHKQSGFPTDCTACHRATDTRWDQGRFDHNNTDFPLQGAHTKLACERCHKGGTYTGLSASCYSCHKADYDGTTDPNHKQSGFPTDCTACHRGTDTSWEQGRFDHGGTDFPLQGAHARLACDRCHVGGSYTGLSSSCYSCHKSNYDSTQDPNHKASGFPTDCVACHYATDTSWSQGRFTHRFPLKGAHNPPCSTCHTNASNYKVFDCLGCHPFSEVSDDHDEVSGFVYNSQACYGCHPDGKE